MSEDGIKNLVRSLRGDKTQEEFAVLLGLSLGYISMVERGVREPGKLYLARLLQAFPGIEDSITGYLRRLPWGFS